MENIETLFSLAQGNPTLIFIVAILATFIESFIPALPLLGIVMINSALLGFFYGVLASLIGSTLGTITLFLLANKAGNSSYFDKFKNEQTLKITEWVRYQSYPILHLCYSTPFVPGCIITIASGFCGKNIKSFAPGMILGKLTMFMVAGYIGNDIKHLVTNPTKISVIIIIIIIAFIIGKNINSKMNKKNNDKNI